MKRLLLHAGIAFCYALSLVVVSTYVLATPGGGWQESLRLALSRQGTASTDNDFLTNNGVYKTAGTAGWVRMLGNASGAVVTTGSGGGYTNATIQQVTVGAGCTAMPASQLSGAALTCVTNHDTAINIFCDDDVTTCTTASGVLVEPRTTICFPTLDRIGCIPASGTPTAGLEEYAP